MPFNLVFAGTPEFSVPILSALIHAQHRVCAVYTQPDRPAGRGRHMHASPIKQLAITHHIPVHQPISLRDQAQQSILRDLGADLMIVVAYGLLLPTPVLNAFPRGCINVHASLLPRWRGAAPIQRAILAGDTRTGITIMQMDKGLDTGPMLKKSHCDIHPQDTSKTLHDKLATLGATTLLEALDALEQDMLTPETQDDAFACYAAKLTKQEANIDWQTSAEQIVRCIHAYHPWPVAYTHTHKETLRIWDACALSHTTTATPGTLVAANADGIDVATTSGILRILRLQLPGGKPLSCAEFLNAKRDHLTPGIHFTAVSPC